MQPPIINRVQELLRSQLVELENHFDGNVITYVGPILDGNENAILKIVEEIAASTHKKDKLFVILTTGGGSATAVERYVNILRHHYNEINFVVPNYAYSAGTIFCMSGDNILMDYSSVLGPIDPQVQNKEGKLVAALGYLDKINELLEKARMKTISQAEFVILKDFDLAELRGYEQAKELTIALLKKWLVKYKFKNWSVHRTDPAKLGQPVTRDEKEQRAKEIADCLSNNNEWKSHGRPINIEALKALKLEITDYSGSADRDLIRAYNDLVTDYVATNQLPIFVQSRLFL